MHNAGPFHPERALGIGQARLTVLIADADADYTAELSQMLIQSGAGINLLGVAASEPDLMNQVKQRPPDVVLLDAGLVRESPQIIAELLRGGIHKVILLVADLSDAGMWSSLQQSGVAVVFKYSSGPAIVEAIRSLPAAAAPSAAAAAIPALAPAAPAKAANPLQELPPTFFPQVVVVHGPVGGAGKTLLSLFLAYLYADKGVTTVLADLSQYGAIAPWLRLPRGSAGLVGLMAALRQGGVADERVRAALVQAPGAGGKLHLVPSNGPAKMDQVKSADVETLLRQLAEVAQVVIVDTGSELTERTLGALLAASRVVLAVNPQVVGGWQSLELLDILRSVYVTRDRIGLALTRIQPGGRFGTDEYEKVLNVPVWGKIPEAADLRTAAERGGPPNVRGSGPGTRAIRRLAHQLVPIFAPKELKGPWPWSR